MWPYDGDFCASADGGQVILETWLQDRARRLATGLLNAVMEAERDAVIGCGSHARSARRRGYRNGYERRWFETSLGRLRLRRPRVRGMDQPFRTMVMKTYQRRSRAVDAAVRRWVAGGLSTRAAAAEVSRTFGGLISAGTVSTIVAQLDETIQAFHRRPLAGRLYRYVFFDGKHVKTCYRRRRRGRGKSRKAVILLAWGVRHNGVEELIDFRVAAGEDEASWTAFLTDLWQRGLRPATTRWEEGLEMIITDGDGGLEAARLMVYDGVPHQRCILHRLRNLAEHVEEGSHLKPMRQEAARIYALLRSHAEGRARLRAWAERWINLEPEAVRWFVEDFDLTLRYLTVPPAWRRRVRTTNPVERFIRELNRQFRRRGICPSEQSWERATSLTWQYLKHGGYAPTQRARPPTEFTRTS